MLNKAIKYGKEKRKSYKGAKAYDYSCKNHGSCPYCKDNRLYNRMKTEIESIDDLEWFELYLEDWFQEF